MNAMLNIQVRVAASQANAALRQVAGGVSGVHKAAAGSGLSKFGGQLGAQLSRLEKFGKNLQWTGRQLEFNFTLPLAIAGVAATKWALANERAMTQVRKVYGDLGMSQKVVKAETDALARSFQLLSNRFGVHQDQVIDIGAAWAAAGSSGVGLAKSVRTTLEAMSIGDMGAEEAIEALITVQSLYRLNSDELAKSLAVLNIVENETAVRFSGLIDVLARAGGAARTAGIDIQHLSAMAAALVPHAASASQAGNALRTIISRITAPTQDAIDIFNRMGIDVRSATWQMANGVQRVEMLAESFDGLTQSQKNVVAATVGSRWQVSRFAVLMEDIASKTGNYNKALQASSDENRNLVTYQRELQAVLDSSPKKFDILTNTMRNALTEAIIPLMPAILGVTSQIAGLAQAFADLDPHTQQLIATLLVVLALLGPVARILGAIKLLVAVLGKSFLFLGKGIFWLAGTALPFLITNFLDLLASVLWPLAGGVDKIIGLFARIGPALMTALGAVASALGVSVSVLVAIVAAAVLAIVVLFRDDLRNAVWDAVKSIGRGIWQLPSIFVAALAALGRGIATMIEKIVDMLSYLNPFARHSPSLVDNVRSGVDVIIDEYGRLSAVSQSLDQAAAAHKRFAAATAGGRARVQGQERAEQRASILEFSPGAGGALAGMYAEIDRLQGALPGLQAQLDQQEAAVRSWEAALDKANAALEKERDHLEVLRDRAADLNAELQQAKDVLNTLADTPIVGMREMEDAIFSNEMAQKRLRLEIMRLEDAAGGSLDELKNKMAALRGEQELLFGEREDLRLAGAGSDILRTYDDQINALREQERATQDIVKPINDAQKALEKLQREGERLDLENSIRFDEQVRQIDQMVNGMNELPFDEIIRRIGEQQVVVGNLEEAQKDANAAVEAQEDVLRRVEEVRDSIQSNLDVEKVKADALRESYSQTEQTIRDMTSAIGDFATQADAALRAAKEAKDSRSTAEELFDAGALGEYEIPGGDSLIGREGDLFDIEAFNKDLENQLKELGEGFGDLDIFKPIKDGFRDAWQWVKDKARPFTQPVIDAVGAGLGAMSGVIDGVMRNASLTGLKNIWGEISGAATTAFGAVGTAIQTAWDTVIFPVLNTVWGWLETVFRPVWDALGTAIQFIWTTIISPAITAAWAVIEPVFQAIVDFIDGYLKPVFEAWLAVVTIVAVLIGRAIKEVWERVISPVFNTLRGWLDNILPTAFNLLKGAVAVSWTIISGFIQANWAVLKVIFEAISWVLRHVVGPAFSWLNDNVVQPVWSGIKTAISGAWNFIKPIFQSVSDFIRNVVGPVFSWLGDEIVKPTFEGIVSVIRSNFNTAMSIVEKGINFFISAFNTLARGINKVADFLNIDVSVSLMDKVSMPRMMAQGGVIPEADGSPGIFNRARAIVGEGNPSYPEFVIPTDPRYRDRALSLWNQAGRRLGHTDEVGGWGPIGWAVDQGKKVVGGVAGAARRGAAKAMFAPLSAAADVLIDRIPFKLARETARSVKDEFYNWVTGADSALPDASVGGNQPIPGGSGGYMRIVDWLRNNSDVPFRVTSTLRRGDPGRHGKGLAVDFAGPQPGWNTPQLRAINEALLPIAKTLNELIYSGPGGQSFKNGRPHDYSMAVQADHHDHVHAALRKGGIFKHRPGGTVIRVAEGGADERVQVLPVRPGDGDGGGRTFHFYGDLTFPNITDPADAETFVRNLEALVD